MIYEWPQANSRDTIYRLLDGAEASVVLLAVLEGTNLGTVYVDDRHAPTAALIWAWNEMFYLLGDWRNERFRAELYAFIVEQVKPQAQRIGDDCLNLELPQEGWREAVDEIFHNRLYRGERVPFVFDQERFWQRYAGKEPEVPSGYELLQIDQQLLDHDASGITGYEIRRFWASTELFLHKGIGFCVRKDQAIVASCLSVYVSGDEYEIGIQTYEVEHRGKGLATAMAAAFVRICIARGGTPHWTTEIFRHDSIVIANKLGFRQLPNYPVYYLPFAEFVER